MSLRQSQAAAWGAMIIMMVVIIVAVCTRVVSTVWEYGTLFFAFMAVFCHLAAILLYRMSASASKKLDISALVFGILAVLALIAVFIINFCEFY